MEPLPQRRGKASFSRRGGLSPRSISISLSVLSLDLCAADSQPLLGTQTPLSLAGSQGLWKPPFTLSCRCDTVWARAGLCPRWGAGPRKVLQANLHRARRRARECPVTAPSRLFTLTAPPNFCRLTLRAGEGAGARSLELSFPEGVLGGPQGVPPRQAALQGLLGSLSEAPHMRLNRVGGGSQPPALAKGVLCNASGVGVGGPEGVVGGVGVGRGRERGELHPLLLSAHERQPRPRPSAQQ